jgi:predicted transcriptional regulator of viral defense system
MTGLTDPTPIDVDIATLASRQHGVVALYQLNRLGLTKNAVGERVKAGRLHPIHRGVYAVGHRVLTREGRWMAAVLACGDGAVLSHASAAHLLGLLRGSGARIHVTSPTRAGRKRETITVHRGDTLAPQDTTSVARIPCTAVPRTLLDLAETSPQQVLTAAIEAAVKRELFDLTAIKQLLARSNGRRGAPLLQQAIALYDDAPTRSELERAFLALCKRYGIPRPEVNVPLDAYVVDFLWRAAKLIVETDGDDHFTKRGTAKDHKRDRRLRNLGWRVERFTWVEVMHEPRTVAQELKALLSAAASAR